MSNVVDKIKALKKSYKPVAKVQRAMCDEILNEIAMRSKKYSLSDKTLTSIVEDTIQLNSTLTPTNERVEILNKLKLILQ